MDSATDTPTKFEECVTTLGGGSHRVWSLIVSFFGDLAQSEGDRVSGALLTQFGQCVGIRREAMRVALHRLRQDGWIDSERDGRTSRYFLTPMGHKESAAASPRIYATTGPGPGSWTILVAKPSTRISDPFDGKEKAMSDLWPVGESIAITSDASDFPAGRVLKVLLTSDNLPEWLRDNLVDPDLMEACVKLGKTLEKIDLSDEDAASFTPLETAALRTLIVHSWRRVRLRQPDLPDWVFPESWKGRECRKHVSRLLEKLPRPDLLALEAEV